MSATNRRPPDESLTADTVTRTRAGDRSRAAPLFTVRVLFCAREGVTTSPRLALRNEGELTLGRAVETSELAGLHGDPSLSRTHARLSWSQDALELVDLGSRNGTFVNGARIDARTLKDGDVIRIGGALLLVRLDPDLDDAAVPAIVGRSPAARGLRSFVSLVGPTPATVLVLGESGVGKGLTARALHEQSGRKGTFVSVNCSAIPDTLAESALFGHEQGAFTGAHKAAPGYFRAAERGTLFLDEIGDLPLPVQAKLLGAIEDRRVTPVGSTTPVGCDVRVLAATHVDLERAVEQKRFRGDLYARLAEMVVAIPPLRERAEDILLLVVDALDTPHPPLSLALAEALLLHRWPYNVRELEKVATELSIRGKHSEQLDVDLVRARLTSAPASDPTTTDEVHAVPSPPRAESRMPIPTRDELVELARDTGGNVSEMAVRTGRSRKHVYRWLEQHHIDVESYRVK